MAAAIFDIAKKLNLYFRIARNGSKVFTFVDTNSEAYSLSSTTFVLNFKKSKGAPTNALQLTIGEGLEVTDNVLTVSVTDETSDLPEGMYYWELYETVSKQTWLFGNAYFTHGYPTEETESTTLTVNLVPDTVRITISTGATTIIEGGAYADNETITGEGTEEDPFRVIDGVYENAGAAAVVAIEGLLREWDNTENKFPDSGGSGTDGAIQRHNRFIGTGTGSWVVRVSGPSETVNEGAEFIAKIDAPGNDPANWWFRG